MRALPMHTPGSQGKRWSNTLMTRYLTWWPNDMTSTRFISLHHLSREGKGHYKELFEQLRRKGFLHARINGEIREITPGLKLDRYKVHFIELVIDKFQVGHVTEKRLHDAVLLALDQGDGIMALLDASDNGLRYYSRHLMCPVTGISYNEPAPHTFSFNSPQGACPKCNGLGEISEVDISRMMPDPSLSIRKGGIEPLGKYRNIWIFWMIEALGEKYSFTVDTP
jgi:excinuclease ABC subunit A